MKEDSRMNYVKIPEAVASDCLPTEIPVFDSKDFQRGLARYYYPYGYRVALLPDFDAEIFNTPQMRKVITDRSGNIVGIKITLSKNIGTHSRRSSRSEKDITT